jgi:4-amino-4-deoxy-L-arabinose transferase-like glycosyltransferase
VSNAVVLPMTGWLATTFGRKRLFLMCISLFTVTSLLCGVAFCWRLGSLGLIDPDQPFCSQSSREMLAAHDWSTPRIFDRPQFEKPILLYWLSMGSFRSIGDNEFAARVPAALFATLLVFLTWAFGARAFSGRAAFLAAVVLATSVEFFVSARMMLTDMVFAAFVCGSVFSLWLASRSVRRPGLWFVVACGMSALAVLTKGPLGVLLPVLAIPAMLLARGHRLSVRPLPLAIGLSIFAAIAVPWYAIMLQRFGRSYFDAFFVHENVERFFHAEHRSNNHAYYYLAVLAAGSIPWTPALAALASPGRRRAMWDDTSRFLLFWGLLCLAFFTLAQSKLPSYVLFLFVPLALLIGRALDLLLRTDGRGRLERWVMGALGLAQAVPFLVAPRMPPYRSLAWPLGLVAACLLIALVLQTRRVSVAWIAASASSSIVLLLVCLTWAGPSVDAIVSTRSLSREILGELRPSETLMTSPLLARGVSYYTRRPVMVLSDRPRPFYTPHPLPIISGSRDLHRYLEGGGSALCATSTHDWARLQPALRRDAGAALATIGANDVARAAQMHCGGPP